MKTKHQFFAVVLLLLVVFTASFATYASDRSVTKQITKEILSEKPTQLQFEVKENLKLDDAEYTVGLFWKSNLGSGSGYGSEGVALLGVFAFALSLFNRKNYILSALLLVATIVAHYYSPEAGGALAIFALPVVPSNNNLKTFRDALGSIQKRMDEILQDAEKEKRNITKEENDEWEQLETRYKEINVGFQRLNENEKRKKELASGSGYNVDNGASGKDLFGKEEVRNINTKLKIGRALSLRQQGKAIDGIEKEVEDEGIKTSPVEVKIDRGYHVPWFLVEPTGSDKKGEKRAQKRREYRTVTIGTEGGDVMQVNLGELIPALRPSPITEQLGVRFLMGLNGDLQFPRKSSVSSLTWLTETGGAAATTPAFDNIKLSPKRVAAYLDFSRQSQIQSVFNMENVLREDLENELAIEWDNKILNGTGAANQPTGIVNTAGVGSVVNGAAGGALTWAKILEFLSDIYAGNVPEDGLQWLTTMQAKAKLMGTSKLAADTFGNFILNDPFNMVAGYKFNATNQLPSNNVKGGSGAVLSTAIFGNWKEAYAGMFGGVNLIFDNLTQATSGNIRLYIEQFMDVKLRHAASFVVSTDVATA